MFFFQTSEDHQKWLKNNQNQYGVDQNSFNANITTWKVEYVDPKNTISNVKANDASSECSLSL